MRGPGGHQGIDPLIALARARPEGCVSSSSVTCQVVNELINKLDFLLTFFLGFVLAFFIGLTGVGGGALVAPSLFVILDLPYVEVIGTSLVFAFLTKLLSATQHIRQKTVHWHTALLFGLWGVPGAIASSYLLHDLEKWYESLFPLLMGGLLIIVAGLLAVDAIGFPRFHRVSRLVPGEISTQTFLGIGAFSLAVGALMGVTSVGSGSLIILSLVYLFTMPAHEVVGTNIVIALIMVLPAAVTHLSLGGVNLHTLGVLLVGSVAGAILGSRTTLLISDRTLRFIVVLMISVSALATLAKVVLG